MAKIHCLNLWTPQPENHLCIVLIKITCLNCRRIFLPEIFRGKREASTLISNIYAARCSHTMKSLYIAAIWIYDLLFNGKMCRAVLAKHVTAPDRHMLRCFYCSCGSLIIICIKIKHLSLCLCIINLWRYSWTPAKKLSHLLMKTSMISAKTNVTVIHFTLHWTMETHTKTF